MAHSNAKENNSPNEKAMHPTSIPTRGKSLATMPKDGKVSKILKSTSFDHYAPSVSEESDERPSPKDFPVFLPWACGELSVGKFIQITVVQDEPAVKREKAKHKLVSPQQLASDNQVLKQSYGTSGLPVNKDDIINIEATYKGYHLIQIKFDKNKSIPEKLFKIIGLIIQFYPSLDKIIINRGLTSHINHEIADIFPLSNITDVVLDNCFIAEANFHIFFDRPNCVKSLSLARCAIGDKGFKEICQKLTYPLPASNTLSILNLPSNKISDIGAGYIANVLRSNRRLKYLNLADNKLTDIGFNKILSTLMPFVLTEEERQAYKTRYMIYLKNRNEIMNQIFNSMLTNKGQKKRVVKTHDSRKGGKSERRKSDSADSEIQYLMDRAESAAIDSCGLFVDPFSENNTKVNNDKLYSNGNHALSYLNVSYNNLSIMTLKVLLNVFEHQKFISINSGISNVYLEGNPVPRTCNELTEIENYLDERLGTGKTSRISHFQKKRLTNMK